MMKEIINPDGLPVEVKVTSKETNIPFMIERFTDIKENQKWMEWPDHLVIFINPDDSNEYLYHGRYEWKKNEWRLQH